MLIDDREIANIPIDEDGDQFKTADVALESVFQKLLAVVLDQIGVHAAPKGPRIFIDHLQQRIDIRSQGFTRLRNHIFNAAARQVKLGHLPRQKSAPPAPSHRQSCAQNLD